MRKSAAVSADLQEKKEADDANDALEDRNNGSSSGTKPLNVGLQTGTSRGDIDQTAVGKLTELGKRPRNEIDKKHYNKKKSKLEHYPEVCQELEEKNQECKHLREKMEWKDQMLQMFLKRDGERESQVSSMMIDRDFQNQQIQFLSRMLEVLLKEKDELKRENEQLKLITQPQPVRLTQPHIAQQNDVPFNLDGPGDRIQQQPVTQQDDDDFVIGLLNSPAPSHSMQIHGGESGFIPWDI